MRWQWLPLIVLLAAIVQVSTGLLGGVDLALVFTLAAPWGWLGLLCGVASGLVVGATAGKAVATAIVYGIAGSATGTWQKAAVLALVATLVLSPGAFDAAIRNAVLAALLARLGR